MFLVCVCVCVSVCDLMERGLFLASSHAFAMCAECINYCSGSWVCGYTHNQPHSLFMCCTCALFIYPHPF